MNFKEFFKKLICFIKQDKVIFGIVALALLGIICIASLDSGTSGDEPQYQYPQSVNLYNYYASLGKDTSCLSFFNLKYYGCSFDLISYAFIKWFHIENHFEARHFMNAITGWGGVLFTGLLAALLIGWKYGILAMLLLFFNPRFLGDSFSNCKDIPFAMTYIMTLLGIAILVYYLPKIKKKTLLFVAVGIAAAISVRVGGLILIAELFMFVAVFYVVKNGFKSVFSQKGFKDVYKIGFKLLLTSILGYLLGTVLWPYALQNPIMNPIRALSLMTNFDIAIRQVFEGIMLWSDKVPWYYELKWLYISMPLFIVPGLIFSFWGFKKIENGGFWAFFLWFNIIFPIFWIAYKNSNVYGGLRHIIFILPSLTVVVTIGYKYLFSLLKTKILKTIAVIVLVLMCLPTIIFMINNHPYEYVFFNKLSGGINKASGNYEMDYYYNSTREASEWVIANAKKSGLETGKKIKVATWHPSSVQYYFRKDTADFQVVFSRWYERENNDWDYAIFTVTGIMPEQIKSTHFPPSNTVHTINVDGNPICVILKRTDKSDLEGFKLKEAKKTVEAIPYFKKALKVDPYNEAALMNLIECYFQVGFPDSAKTLIDHSLAFLPSYEPANYFNAHYYISKGNPDEALKSCKKIIKDNFKFSAAYYLACNIYVTQRDLNSAEKMLGKLIDIDQIDNQGVQMLIQIYMAQGLNEQGAYKKLYKKMAKSLEKRGKEKEAEEFWDMYHKL